ncbi:DUF7546 family protein [Haloarcula nitratireducens]|uniref:ABC transporter ATP-binding protein n=1 Tax=Haloarcula nitratireducens TaxID=2487749 RepID=A0AAW4P7F9_9EURY|nr:hypothetical protein [Halomicroarcula nitratireducens]MBX0293819.1 hypothetical protein [Halomicroarcula nitratireducens]
MSTITRRFDPSFDRETLLYGALLLNTELLLVAMHVLFGGTSATSWRGVAQYVYPLVWINAGLLVVLKTTPPPVSTKQRRRALAVGVAYFLVLAAIGGIVRPGSPDIVSYVQFNLLKLPPGWNPMLAYFGNVVSVTLIPYKLVGYGALSYLVYVMVLDTSGLSLGSLTGLFSCVSCVLGILVPTVSSVLGGTAAAVGQLVPQSYGAATVVYLVSLALLYWRPIGR